MKKIVVLVSGGGTNLKKLIEAQEKGIIKNGKITCVISSRADAFALERAKAHKIKTRIIERSAYPDIKAYSRAMLEALCGEQADLVVYAGFLTILDNQITDSFKNQMINVHPALVPSFSGKGFYGIKVHEEALKRGVKLTGATVHFVTEDCDGGPIIMQKAVNVLDSDTPEILQHRVMEEAEWEILPKAVSLFCDDKIKVIDGKAIIEE